MNDALRTSTDGLDAKHLSPDHLAVLNIIATDGGSTGCTAYEVTQLLNWTRHPQRREVSEVAIDLVDLTQWGLTEPPRFGGNSTETPYQITRSGRLALA